VACSDLYIAKVDTGVEHRGDEGAAACAVAGDLSEPASEGSAIVLVSWYVCVVVFLLHAQVYLSEAERADDYLPDQNRLGLLSTLARCWQSRGAHGRSLSEGWND
jgi:hypothetical protein